MTSFHRVGISTVVGSWLLFALAAPGYAEGGHEGHGGHGHAAHAGHPHHANHHPGGLSHVWHHSAYHHGWYHHGWHYGWHAWHGWRPGWWGHPYWRHYYYSGFRGPFLPSSGTNYLYVKPPPQPPVTIMPNYGTAETITGVASALEQAGQQPTFAAAVAGLTRQLTGPSPSLRQVAAVALGNIGPAARTAIPTLQKALADSSVEVRRSAAFALGTLGPDAADSVPALRKALKDKDVEVRQLA